MILFIRPFLILFFIVFTYGQKKQETYSFTMKEVLSFKNRIKELEKKDSLNAELIQKLEDRIRMYKKELGESRTKNDFLLEILNISGHHHSYTNLVHYLDSKYYYSHFDFS